LFAAGFVGGDVLYAPGSRIVKWSGASWETVGGGIDLPADEPHTGPETYITSLCAGPDLLVVAGSLRQAGEVVVQNTACWNGFAWHPFAPVASGEIDGIIRHNGEWVIGGDMKAESGARFRAARLQNGGWVPIGADLNGGVTALLSYDGVLIAGGRFDASGGRRVRHVGWWKD